MRSNYTVAVHLFFLRDEKVLLIRRFNTGYEDGNYSVIAGHVEAGESVIQAAIREACEEAGVSLDPADLEIVHVMNRRSEDERIDFFITVRHWMGVIINNEPHKCDQFLWSTFDLLPKNIIPYVRQGFENYRAGKYYSEFGWL
jgi:8-oxo-dGTP pyrophosphatase MutT (NUDIX family)